MRRLFALLASLALFACWPPTAEAQTAALPAPEMFSWEVPTTAPAPTSRGTVVQGSSVQSYGRTDQPFVVQTAPAGEPFSVQTYGAPEQPTVVQPAPRPGLPFRVQTYGEPPP